MIIAKFKDTRERSCATANGCVNANKRCKQTASSASLKQTSNKAQCLPIIDNGTCSLAAAKNECGQAMIDQSAHSHMPTKNECGQAVVELAVAFPVVIIVAVIAINALLFISDCAAFDRIVRQSVRTYAASAAYGETTAQVNAQIQSAVQTSFSQPYQKISVASESVAYGFIEYTVTLECSPTLFGLGLTSEVFGVSLPTIHHSTSLTVDTYRTGVFL